MAGPTLYMGTSERCGQLSSFPIQSGQVVKRLHINVNGDGGDSDNHDPWYDGEVYVLGDGP